MKLMTPGGKPASSRSWNVRHAASSWLSAGFHTTVLPIVGIYGLEDTGAQWMKTALGLLVTGMLAQGYALYCSVKRMQETQGPA